MMSAKTTTRTLLQKNEGQVSSNANYSSYMGNYLRILASFSTLSTLLHVLPLSRYYRNKLFSANIFSLVGFSMIIFFFPSRLFMKYGETFRNILQQLGLYEYIDANVYTLNTIAWILHAIPVAVLFYYKYSPGNPIGWMLLYLIFASQYLMVPSKRPSHNGAVPSKRPSQPPTIMEEIYNMNLIELAFIATTTSIVCIGIYVGVNTFSK